MPIPETPAEARTDGRMSYTQRVLIAVVIVGVALAFGQLLINAIWTFLAVFAGVLFGVFLCDVSQWISRWTRLPYWGALALLIVLLIVAMGGFLFYLGMEIIHQASNLGGQLERQVDRLYADLYNQLGGMPWLQQFLPEQRPSLQELLPQSGVSFSTVSTAISHVIWFVAGIIVIFVVGVYTAADAPRYEKGIIKLVPISRRGRAREVLYKLQGALGRWIVGRLISMAIIGVGSAFFLLLLGVPLPFALGVLAALLTFVPNFGPILSTIPEALMAIQVSPMTVIYVIIFKLLLQLVETHVITPLVQQAEVTMPPVLTIAMQFALGTVFGLLGIIMAAPLVASGMVLVQMLYIHDVLGDPTPGQLVDAQARAGS